MIADGVNEIEASIKSSIREHDPRMDSILFNGGTIVALAASIAVTAHDWSGDLEWLPRVLAGLAAFLIGVERALNFGGRWRFHLRMRDAYRSLLARLAVARTLPEPQRAAAVERVLNDLEAIRRGEGGLPIGGSTGAATG
jgi:hypothetical protein